MSGIFFLMKKKKIYRRKAGYIFEFELPEFAINLGTEQDAAADCATSLLNYLKSNIENGRDALGNQHQPSEATIRWRKNDRHPPTTTRQAAGPFIRRTKSGKAKIVSQKQRWAERYPDGKGSLGGSTSFVDSGHLLRGLHVEISGNSAFVTVPPARARAVNSIQKGTYGKGNMPTIPLIHAKGEPIDAALRARLEKAFSSSPIGRLVTEGSKMLGGLLLTHLAGGLAEPISEQPTEQNTESQGEASTST